MSNYRYQEAKYSEPVVESHRGNPLLEALPAPLSERALYQRLRTKPQFDRSKHSQLPTEVRTQVLHELHGFFQPLPRHVSLYNDIELAIRGGYVHRNPAASGYEAQSGDRVGAVYHVAQRPVSLKSGLLMGMSGTGKTCSLERILGMMPQVIKHTSYNGKPFPHMQLVWLKLGCPADGSPRALCTSFFTAVDMLLGTEYVENHLKDHRSASTMLPSLASVGTAHTLGLLVIDEVQNLSKTKAGGALKLLNYLVEVVNVLSVPVLLVGNSNALTFLSSTMRLARRSTGLLHPHWPRFSETDSDWEVFLEELWDCQILKVRTELTSELRRTFFDLTQGIADHAVKLWYAVQHHLLLEAEEERVTPEVLSRVARQMLAPTLDLLRAIREHDYAALSEAGDVHPIDILGPCEAAMKGWPRKKPLVAVKRRAEIAGDTAQLVFPG